MQIDTSNDVEPIRNPFSPGAGAAPPELVGREPLLERARRLLGRIKAGRSRARC